MIGYKILSEILCASVFDGTCLTRSRPLSSPLKGCALAESIRGGPTPKYSRQAVPPLRGCDFVTVYRAVSQRLGSAGGFLIFMPVSIQTKPALMGIKRMNKRMNKTAPVRCQSPVEREVALVNTDLLLSGLWWGAQK